MTMDQHEITTGIFLELSKAFDRKILFQKLEYYGIRGPELQWIKSYLTNRIQFVQFGETRSSDQIIRCGVPQGCILCPYFLFFTLMISQTPLI